MGALVGFIILYVVYKWAFNKGKNSQNTILERIEDKLDNLK